MDAKVWIILAIIVFAVWYFGFKTKVANPTGLSGAA